MYLLIKEGVEELCTLENCRRVPRLVLNYVNPNHKFLYASAGVLAITVIVKYGAGIKNRYFAWLCNKCTNIKFEEYESLKRDLLKSLATLESHDPQLRIQKTIKILEVGVGAGANFKFYPVGCHLVAVDPNPHFEKYYNDKRANFPQIKSADIVVSTGEAMDMVESNSVDAVVMTLVLCSVRDVTKVISQIKRVLVPGGKFYFSEHILEFDTEKHAWRRRLQKFLTSTGIWPFIGDGCCLNRDPLPALRAVGFSDIQYKVFHGPVPVKLFAFLSPHLMGVATK
ncbi:Methyltransferase domain [Halocaridina rubra]|uniref:Methyltransferase domain n=1 Tax=Halocaridina rubra TaxID=373956 RepID=A0AAN9A1P8_HALRR